MADDREPETSAPKRLARYVGRPVTGYLDRRFEDLHHHVDHRADALGQRIDMLQAEVERLGNSARFETLAATVAGLEDLTETIRRFADRFADRTGEVADAFSELLSRAENLDRGPGSEAGGADR
ncbi:MAG: hypothetical protein M5U31_15965 [Acidimicrobiia bacterium]|nr:hypothetical protein [Acidimicrobiia bacterium]